MNASSLPFGDSAICSIDGKFPYASTGTAVAAGEDAQNNSTEHPRHRLRLERISMGPLPPWDTVVVFRLVYAKE
jgi:hypothetical protein